MAKKNGNAPAMYTIELTENQLMLVNTALEEWFRIPLNQWSDLADRLARKGVDFSKDNPRHSEIFDNYIIRRDAVHEIMRSIGRILWPQGTPMKSENQLVAEDIWQCIRHQLWIDGGRNPNNWIDSHPALHLSEEPLPTIRRIEPKG